ncbi:MAG: YceI family protein [Myxococcales bacterium]|nr:YceI family protein [Myxococcales bacterium]
MSTSTISNPSTSNSSVASNTAALAPVTKYAVDASHSSVGFGVRHLMITTVRGEFSQFAGSFSYDASRPELTKLEANIEVGSVNTREPKRDEHLRSADFFDAANHPSMTFVSTSARRDGDKLIVSGQLTIRGTSKPVVLTVSDITPEQTDPWGNKRIGATARATILRSDYGMTWNAALEAGGVMVSDKVTLEIEASLVRQA